MKKNLHDPNEQSSDEASLEKQYSDFDYPDIPDDLSLEAESSEKGGEYNSTGNSKNVSKSRIEKILALDSDSSKITSDQDEIQKNRRKIANSLTQSSFVFYLLGSYWELRKFARSSSVLRPKFLLRFSMSPMIPQFFNKALVLDTVIPLQKIVEKMLKRAWLYVNKLDYNLLVGLNRLCINLMRIDFPKISLDPGVFSERLRFVYLEYLPFFAYPKFVKQIQNVFNYLWENMENFEGTPGEYLYRIRVLLEADLMQPSLYNALLGASMVKARRIFPLRDIITPQPGILFSENSYEVTSAINDSIEAYLKSIEKELIPLFEKLHKYKVLRRFVPRKKNGDPDTQVLEMIYDQHLPGRFMKDQESIALFASHFLATFVELSNPILSANFKTNISEKSLVFSSQIFEKFSARLLYLSDQLAIQHDYAPGFHRDRFLTLILHIKGVDVPSKKEKQILAEIEEAMSLLREIAEKLAHILSSKQPTPGDTVEMAPLENFLIQSGQFVLPYESALILEAGFFLNKSVEEVLVEIAQIANSFCAFLGEQELSAQRREEEITKQKIKNYLQMIERIADQKQLISFRDRLKDKLTLAKDL